MMTLDELIPSLDYTVNQSQAYGIEIRRKDAEQLLRWLEDYKELKEATRWISCSERLPNVDQDVMLWMRGCYVDIGHFTSYGMWSIDIIDYDIKNATHWMPLPDPPKGDAE